MCCCPLQPLQHLHGERRTCGTSSRSTAPAAAATTTATQWRVQLLPALLKNIYTSCAVRSCHNALIASLPARSFPPVANSVLLCALHRHFFSKRHKRERAVLAGCAVGNDAPAIAVPLIEALAGPVGVVAACSALIANTLAGAHKLHARGGGAAPAITVLSALAGLAGVIAACSALIANTLRESGSCEGCVFVALALQCCLLRVWLGGQEWAAYCAPIASTDRCAQAPGGGGCASSRSGVSHMEQ